MFSGLQVAKAQRCYRRRLAIATGGCYRLLLQGWMQRAAKSCLSLCALRLYRPRRVPVLGVEYMHSVMRATT